MSTKTRCKFKISEVTIFEYAGHERIKADAVYGGSEENQSFAAATPSGTLEIYVSNPEVVGKYKPGMELYLDITPVTSN